MSWDSYVKQLESSGQVKKACIVGNDGNLWAKSDGFEVQPGELTTLAVSFRDSTGLRENGIHIAGKKYFFLRSTDSEIHGKSSACGCTVQRADKCFIIGLYDEGIQPGNCNTTVGRIVDYLKGAGY